MTQPSRDPSLICAVREMPNVAKSPIGKAAFWAVMATFGSVVVGGWSFGHHRQVLGLVFAALAGLSLVALLVIGLMAAVTFAPNMVRRALTTAQPPGWAAPPQGEQPVQRTDGSSGTAGT